MTLGESKGFLKGDQAWTKLFNTLRTRKERRRISIIILSGMSMARSKELTGGREVEDIYKQGL